MDFKQDWRNYNFLKKIIVLFFILQILIFIWLMQTVETSDRELVTYINIAFIICALIPFKIATVLYKYLHKSASKIIYNCNVVFWMFGGIKFALTGYQSNLAPAGLLFFIAAQSLSMLVFFGFIKIGEMIVEKIQSSK